MESSREQNYWPAFVDALSNVVLTLVFVLIIFVFALVIESQKVSQKLQEVTTNSSEQENVQLKQQVAALTAEVEKLSSQTSMSQQNNTGAINPESVNTTQNQDKQITVTDKEADKLNQGPVDIQQSRNSVTLKFPLSVAEMDQKSQDQLGHVLDALQKSVGKHKIIMHSILGRETYSVAQRMAYYRAISARNYLITKMGETPENISISIVNPPQPEEGRVEIILEKE